MSQQHDVIIVGGGPAGLAAALYAGRAGLDSVLFEGLVHGGQMASTSLIENYPGFARPVKSADIIEAMVEQAKRYGCLFADAQVGEAVIGDGVEVAGGDLRHRARALIIASGARPRVLGIPGERELRGRGVSYCATCDGPLFAGRPVAVVGGGDSACEEAYFLSRFASEVYLIHRRDRLRAVKTLQELVLKSPKIRIFWDAVPAAVEGEKAVAGILLQNVLTGARTRLDAAGVFFYVGSDPNTEFIKFDLARDKKGYILADETTRTSVEGVFAAGDVRSKVLRQVVTAASDGALAAHMAGRYIFEHQAH